MRDGTGVDHSGVDQMLMHGVVVWCAAAFIDVTAMVLRPACCSSARVSANLPRTSSGVAVWIRPCAQFVAPPPSRSWYRVDQAARVQFVEYLAGIVAVAHPQRQFGVALVDPAVRGAESANVGEV
ncbi:MAG: hypothetical protein B5766_02825 [Candidatus Lumbricidophila eiseniae]|uniref:Uncharacterized protein n=1 Tax=Candidatus Lumbricidiphila eiseniae TaxID=1969409 RepID=A0A2A6FTY2_9MICO|nr:MAG: hypothetical protein B5766_02825 [Candidatus Lumbricidophila eiseniae]